VEAQGETSETLAVELETLEAREETLETPEETPEETLEVETLETPEVETLETPEAGVETLETPEAGAETLETLGEVGVETMETLGVWVVDPGASAQVPLDLVDKVKVDKVKVDKVKVDKVKVDKVKVDKWADDFRLRQPQTPTVGAGIREALRVVSVATLEGCCLVGVVLPTCPKVPVSIPCNRKTKVIREAQLAFTTRDVE
jgi:hypothetical protein